MSCRANQRPACHTDVQHNRQPGTKPDDYVTFLRLQRGIRHMATSSSTYTDLVTKALEGIFSWTEERGLGRKSQSSKGQFDGVTKVPIWRWM